MAHALPGARSITALRSTRTKDGRTSSNIVWNYGHTTIPRHLRDIVVTEYGVADLRGKSDRDVIAALLNVADSRFQPALLREAVASGKLPAGHVIAAVHRNNFPQVQQRKFALARARGNLGRLKTIAAALTRWDTPASLSPALQRMNLERPRSWRERIWQRLLVRELMSNHRPRRGPA